MSHLGSYPQSRISLERHGTLRGHSGVHLQLSYHKVENPLNVGTLYLFLDVNSTDAMQDIAEGFIYSLYEMLGEIGDIFIEMRSDLFHEELVLDLKMKKGFFLQQLHSGIDSRDIEVVELDGSRRILSIDEFAAFIGNRKELIPIFGLME